MAETLKLTILSPERKLVDDLEITSISLFGAEGQIEILPGYAPFVSTLETGIFTYRSPAGKTETGVISSGFIEVEDDHVRVVAETLELQGEIDVSRARRAQEEAEEELRSASLTEESFRKYQLKLQRAIVRQQVAIS